MEQISKVLRCYHCGKVLQSTDPKKEGYIHDVDLENPGQYFLFCDECFKAERFRSTSNEPMIDDDFITIIKEAKSNDCLLVYVINLLNFETSFSREVVEAIKDMKIMVVGMKYDLLPKGTDKEKIAEYVAHRFRVAGIKITSNDVSISSKDEDDVREILTKIYELKDAKNVYTIGSTEAGKTTLIENFLKIYSNLSNGTISNHYYKDTKIRVTEIPMSKTSSMFETPGISITNSILFGLDSKTLKLININKPLESRLISISKGHSLFIGGLAVVELLSGPKTDITCYFQNNVELTKNHIRNVEDKFIALNKKKELIPSLNKIESIKDMETFEIEMQDGDGRYRDIGFSGLGWITMKSMNQKIRVYLPKSVSLYTSRPKIEIK